MVQANTNQSPAHSTLVNNDLNEFSEEKDPLPITAETNPNSVPKSQINTSSSNQKQEEKPGSDIENASLSAVCEEGLASKLAEAPVENLTKK